MDWLADFYVMPDVDEIEALASQTIPAFKGDIEVKRY